VDVVAFKYNRQLRDHLSFCAIVNHVLDASILFNTKALYINSPWRLPCTLSEDADHSHQSHEWSCTSILPMVIS
jgi:hypothetical protein